MDDVQRYLDMQKGYYSVHPDHDTNMDLLVGAFQHHEAYPYEKYLLNSTYDDIGELKTYFAPLKEKIALDFGCGPGRMIRRMSKFFKRVDGVDISAGMIAGARRRCYDLPNRPFLWEIDGKSFPGIPDETYDFVYCTISFHHICSYPIRMALLSEFSRVLKKGGSVALQMMYTTHERSAWQHHVDWRESNHNAMATNGYHDVRITPDNLPQVKEDFASVGLVNFDYRLAPPPFSHETTTDFIFIYASKE